MSNTYADVLFWPEERLIERPRKGFVHDPTELAEALLTEVAMQVHSIRGHSLMGTSQGSAVRLFRNRVEHTRRLSASEGVLIFSGRSRAELPDVWMVEEAHVPLSQGVLRGTHVAITGSSSPEPLAMVEPPYDWKFTDEIFNRAAELLWDRYRRESEEAIRVYLSNAAPVRRGKNRAEVDRRLEEAFNSREAMAALMTEGWLGLRLLSELAESEKSTISSLSQRVGADIDATAVALAQLVKNGMTEASGRFFVCSSRGRTVLRNLEDAAQSGDIQQDVPTSS